MPLGISHVGGVCLSQIGFNTAVIESSTTDITQLVTLAAHELGHK